MSKVTALYHIVFATRNREMTIPSTHKNDLYRVIWSILEQNKCKLYRIGGIGNHVHILLNLNASKSLAEVVRAVKSQSSNWMRSSGLFPHFTSWASEYFAATVSFSTKDSVIQYIMEQESHHSRRQFTDELQALFLNAGLNLTDKDMI
jgi:REP element-mobilizing transposase RayT